MSPPEAAEPRAARWRRLGRSLGARLALLLLAALAATFGLLGALIVHHHQENLEAATLAGAERVSDLIERSTTYSMLRNDREGLDHVIETIAGERGVVRIRVFDEQGRVTLSTDAGEEGTYVDTGAEACSGCHEGARPVPRLERPHRFRIWRQPDGTRAIGIINPIENQPSCWQADCHAHPPEQRILGVLDTGLSLAEADEALASSTREMIAYMLAAAAGISLLTGVFVLRFVHRPVRALKAGTSRLAAGDLGLQIDLRAGDELGDLADSFNVMSRQLREAREESTGWARTLEARVEEKGRELKAAHDHVLQVEKMASIGRLAATVAHEINNPLSGILTYAKLLKRWSGRGQDDPGRREQIDSALDLIETESRRCGAIVKNLLTFARAAPMNLEWTNPNAIAERCVRLVRHQLELAGTQLHVDLDPEVPAVHGDPAQLEQVLLALVVNAVEATPRGGNVRLASRVLPGGREVRLEVADDGVGIPPEVLPNVFEPFFTTKEAGRGVGLGLAVSRGIVERHGGTIEVESAEGRGTTFTVTLPVAREQEEVEPAGAGAARPGGPS